MQKVLYLSIPDEDEDSDDDTDQVNAREVLGIDDLALNQFVLYQWKDNEHYVGTVDDIQVHQ